MQPFGLKNALLFYKHIATIAKESGWNDKIVEGYEDMADYPEQHIKMIRR